MKLHSMHAVALAAALAATGAFVSTASAANDQMLGQRYRNEIRVNIADARTALAHDHRLKAASLTGNAETTLLNATQAKLYSSPAALSALERAHDSIEAHNLNRAAHQLRLAETELPPISS